MHLGTNEKAWTGLNILVFGHTPILPMQIEQAMAKASPANELKIDSFENYDQAYDFCKNQKSVGLIFIEENADGVLSADTFKQLAAPYESRGWPCYGVLFHKSAKSMMGYLSLRKNPNLISYVDARDLIEEKTTFATMNEIWMNFVSAFENAIIPPKLQETLASLAQPNFSRDSILFTSRVMTALAANLNLSWLDMVGIRWSPIVDAVKVLHPAALDPNQVLVEICKPTAVDGSAKTISEAAVSKASLPSRLSTIVSLLDSARINGELPEVLSAAQSLAKPGAPAIVRQLAKNADVIKMIGADYGSAALRSAK